MISTENTHQTPIEAFQMQDTDQKLILTENIEIDGGDTTCLDPTPNT